MIGALVAKKAIADAFEALNRHDLQGFMSPWRDDGIFIYPGEIPESGTFKGKTAVEGWFLRFFEQFPEIRFDIQDICARNIFDLVGTNTVAVHWNIYLTNRGGRVGENSGVTMIYVKRGKVYWVRDFIFDLGRCLPRPSSADIRKAGANQDRNTHEKERIISKNSCNQAKCALT